MRKAACAALALLLLAAAVPALLTLTVSSVGSSTPTGPVPCVPVASPDGPELRVRIAHANLYIGMTKPQFSDDLATVVAGASDVVTLNETYGRTPAQLTPPGYAAWRPAEPRDARDTTVLWRADTWRPVEQGSQLMHQRAGVKWGTRYATWVTLQHSTGAVLSVNAGHASPGGLGREGLIEDYVAALNTLITRLAARGPVLVGTDLNIGYRAHPELSDRLTTSRTVSTRRPPRTRRRLGHRPISRRAGDRLRPRLRRHPCHARDPDTCVLRPPDAHRRRHARRHHLRCRAAR